MKILDSDSVTNVTRLNRVNHRRVLIYMGNKKGLVAYGMGKGVDYDQAFHRAFKIIRKHLILLEWDIENTSPVFMKARHNDFKLRIYS